jgi:hypothetical protein
MREILTLGDGRAAVATTRGLKIVFEKLVKVVFSGSAVEEFVVVLEKENLREIRWNVREMNRFVMV